MRERYLACAFAAAAILAANVVSRAEARISVDEAAFADTRPLRTAVPYLQCVPYARQVSGIGIYGDAHTWWGQAEGRYARGREPRVGAVMAFRPYGNMRLGHVAAVSRIVDSRTVLLRHASVGEALRKRVLSAAAALGYEPNPAAQGMRGRSTRAVGLMVSDVSNPLFSATVSAAEEVLYRAGYQMILANSRDSPATEKEILGLFGSTWPSSTRPGVVTKD